MDYSPYPSLKMSGKRPVRAMNSSTTPSGKRACKAITLDVMFKVIGHMETGKILSSITKAIGIVLSTVDTIKQNKEKIKQV